MLTSELISDYYDNNGAALAADAGVSRQAVSQWGEQVPTDRVLPLCRSRWARFDWGLTPHKIRPDIYPNELDGIPPDLIEHLDAAA